jgi:hypothetical protein
MIAAVMFFAIAVMNCQRDAGSENPNLLIHLWRKLRRLSRNHQNTDMKYYDMTPIAKPHSNGMLGGDK